MTTLAPPLEEEGWEGLEEMARGLLRVTPDGDRKRKKTEMYINTRLYTVEPPRGTEAVETLSVLLWGQRFQYRSDEIIADVAIGYGVGEGVERYGEARVTRWAANRRS